MPYKERETEKIYYSIGEVAGMFKVATSLIRFWEKEFDILKPVKNKKGNRLFTRADITNLKMIHHLVKEKGFTLQGARDKLKISKTTDVSDLEIIESLKRLKDLLLEVKTRL
jgi:DNA-binding transcriptional MerR regulator